MENQENSVFIGQKDTLAYVFAVQTQAKEHNKIIIKARGKAISRAVDVSQISINKSLEGWYVTNVLIGTEDRISDSNERSSSVQKVSFIEITIEKR